MTDKDFKKEVESKVAGNLRLTRKGIKLLKRMKIKPDNIQSVCMFGDRAYVATKKPASGLLYSQT